MEERSIKIGQRIVLKREAETSYYEDKNFNFKAGMRGKIIDTDCNKNRCLVLIQFDDHINGHDGDGKGKRGHCWYLSEKVLVYIAKVIKRKNNY